MTFSEYKSEVEAALPFDYSEMITETRVDSTLNRAVRKALSKFEKVKTVEISGTQEISDALSVVECVPTFSRDFNNVFALDVDYSRRMLGYNRINRPWRFETSTRKIYVAGFSHVRTSNFTVKYVVDPNFLKIEDLNDVYTEWAIDYGAALLKINEGSRGSLVNVSATGLEYNYEQIKQEGIEERDRRIEDLEELYYGLFAIRT